MADPKKYSFRKEDKNYVPGIKTGEPPGTLIYVGDEKSQELSITVIQYKEDKVVEFKTDSIEDLTSKMQKGFLTWINIDGVHDSRVINDIGRAFHLENLSMEDVMNTNSRPKFEEFEDYVFIVLKDLHCPNEEDFGLNAKMQIIHIAPGAQPRSHYHKVRTELAQIISGTGDIVVNGEAVVSKPGEFVLVKPEEVHTVVKRGEDALVTMLLIANDPGPEDMIYVEEEENNE